MKQRLQLVLIFLTVSWVILYLAVFLYSLVNIPLTIIQAFRISWIFNNSLCLFFGMLPATQFTILIFVYSFYLPKKNLNKITITYPQLLVSVNKALIFFLFLTALYIFGYEFFIPAGKQKISSIEETSKVILNLNRQIDKSIENNNLQRQLQLYRVKHSLLPENEIVNDEIISLQNKIYHGKSDHDLDVKSKESNKTSNYSSISKNSKYYTDKALYYYQKKQWSSSIYYANLAVNLDPTNTEAERLLDQSWTRVLNPDEKKETTLFDKKKFALSVLENGNPIQAYYHFKALSLQSPKDSDIQKYLSKSREKLLEKAFFYSEVKNIDSFSRFSSDLLFIHETQGGKKYFFHWDKIVSINNTLYIQNLEAIAFSSSWEFIYHMHAPYGKIVDNNLLTTCLSQDDKENQRKAKILRGREITFPPVFPLPREINRVPNSGFSTTDLKNLTLAKLISLRPIISSLGYSKEMVESEIIDRLIRVLGFFAFSFIAVALGWSTRISVKLYPPSWGYVIILPLILLFVYYLYELYIHINLLIAGYFLLSWGTLASRGILIGIQGVTIVFSLIYYIKQFKITQKASLS